MIELDRLFRVANWFMLGMCHLHLAWCVNIWPAVIGRITVVTHIGRTSGIRRETPVNPAVVDDVWCTTMPQAAWCKNLVVDPEVEVWLPGGRRHGTAQDVPVTADSVPMLRQVPIASGFAAPTFGGIPPRTATVASSWTSAAATTCSGSTAVSGSPRAAEPHPITGPLRGRRPTLASTVNGDGRTVTGAEP